MKYNKKLVHGYFLKRYKRFLADIRLDNGSIVTAHCTNSGSMKSCLEENAEVYLSHHSLPHRKTEYTWEMIKINESWVGVNTIHPNQIIYEALAHNEIKSFPVYSVVRREVTWGDSRLDIYAENDQEACFCEVKNVTLKDGIYARFPDAVTIRGQKHLKTLMDLRKTGKRAVMIYVVQRGDVEIFAPAREIDSEYSDLLKLAFDKGVEIIPLVVNVTPDEIKILKMLPVEL